MQNALNTANPDGTYNISPAPSGCRITTQELLGKARVAGVNITREMQQIFKDWTEATEGVAKLNDEERNKAWAEYQKAWNGVPEPLRDAATAAACYAIIPATKGKALKGGALAATCGAALGIDLTIPDLPPDDGGGSGSGGSGSGGSSQQPTPNPNAPDGDYNGDGTTDAEELGEANRKHWDEEITDEEYERIVYKFFCDSGDSDYCNK